MHVETKGTKDTNLYFRLNVTVTQDTAKKQSTLHIAKIGVKAPTNYDGTLWVQGSVTIAGKTAAVCSLGANGCGIPLKTNYNERGDGDWSSDWWTSHNVTVTHNADGTAAPAVKFALSVIRIGAGGSYETIDSAVATVNATLPTIEDPVPNAGISVSNGTMGTAMAISLTNTAAKGSYTVKVKPGTAAEVTIATKSTGKSFSWTPSKDLADQVPNGTKIQATFVVITYNGSTQVGTSSKTVDISTGSMPPSISAVTLTDKQGLTTDMATLVQGHSQLRVRTTAAGQHGATIKSIAVSCGVSSATGADVNLSLPNSGSMTVTIKVTDSRGQTAQTTRTVTVLAYSRPVVTMTQAYRCSQDGTPDGGGRYAKLVFNATANSLALNNISYTARIQKYGTTTWADTAITEQAGQISVTGGYVIVSAPDEEAYVAKIVAADRYDSGETILAVIQAPFALLDFNRTAKAAGILRRAGDAGKISMGGEVAMGGNKISGLADPTAAQDAVTKAYLERVIASINGKN